MKNKFFSTSKQKLANPASRYILWWNLSSVI